MSVMSDLDQARREFGIPADHPQALQLTTDALLRHRGEVIVGASYYYEGRAVLVSDITLESDAFYLLDGHVVHAADLTPLLQRYVPPPIVIPPELAAALRGDLRELVRSSFLGADGMVQVVRAEDWPAGRELLALLGGE